MKNVIGCITAKIINKYLIIKHRVKVGYNTKFNGIVYLFANQGIIRIGRNCVINSGGMYNLIGGDQRTIVRTLNKGRIIIGNNVGISNSTLVARKEIIIKDNVFIGGSCKIYDNDFHSLDYYDRIHDVQRTIGQKAIMIDEGAFIGAHSIILKGVRIGKHSIVGAGSVVTKDIPDNEIWGGNPAKFIKKL